MYKKICLFNMLKPLRIVTIGALATLCPLVLVFEHTHLHTPRLRGEKQHKSSQVIKVPGTIAEGRHCSGCSCVFPFCVQQVFRGLISGFASTVCCSASLKRLASRLKALSVKQQHRLLPEIQLYRLRKGNTFFCSVYWLAHLGTTVHASMTTSQYIPQSQFSNQPRPVH